MSRTSAAVLLLVAAVFTTAYAASSSYVCPKKDGQYQDDIQCDKYYECKEGIAKEKLCPDGLVFDEHIRKINKCDQPFNVDCEDRIELQTPISNAACPRRNGFFAHPNPTVCDVFYNCIEGDHTEIKCTTGLHFDEYQGICVWPDSAGRQGCGKPESESKNKEKLKDGFECPEPGERSGQTTAHPQFAHPEDCQKFYVCLNGVTPRELGCPLGQAYNDATHMCDAPENVAGCEDWYKEDDAGGAPAAKPTNKSEDFYKDHPDFAVLFHDADGDGKKDFGDRRVFDQVNVNRKRQ